MRCLNLTILVELCKYNFINNSNQFIMRFLFINCSNLWHIIHLQTLENSKILDNNSSFEEIRVMDNNWSKKKKT